jgi:hypothetical protein
VNVLLISSEVMGAIDPQCRPERPTKRRRPSVSIQALRRHTDT